MLRKYTITTNNKVFYDRISISECEFTDKTYQLIKKYTDEDTKITNTLCETKNDRHIEKFTYIRNTSNHIANEQYEI